MSHSNNYMHIRHVLLTFKIFSPKQTVSLLHNLSSNANIGILGHISIFKGFVMILFLKLLNTDKFLSRITIYSYKSNS